MGVRSLGNASFSASGTGDAPMSRTRTSISRQSDVIKLVLPNRSVSQPKKRWGSVWEYVELIPIRGHFTPGSGTSKLTGVNRRRASVGWMFRSARQLSTQ